MPEQGTSEGVMWDSTPGHRLWIFGSCQDVVGTSVLSMVSSHLTNGRLDWDLGSLESMFASSRPGYYSNKPMSKLPVVEPDHLLSQVKLRGFTKPALWRSWKTCSISFKVSWRFFFVVIFEGSRFVFLCSPTHDSRSVPSVRMSLKMLLAWNNKSSSWVNESGAVWWCSVDHHGSEPASEDAHLLTWQRHKAGKFYLIHFVF